MYERCQSGVSCLAVETTQQQVRQMQERVTGQAAGIESDDAPVLASRDGAVAILTLNRPAARNALSMEMIAALTEQVKDGLGGSH